VFELDCAAGAYGLQQGGGGGGSQGGGHGRGDIDPEAVPSA